MDKREMLYTLMTFPQWLSKTTAPLKCIALAKTRGESPLLNRGREILSPLSVHSARPANGGGVGGHGAYRGQPLYCPTSTLPYPGLIVPLDPTHGHIAKPPQPKLTFLHPPPPTNPEPLVGGCPV